MKKTISNLIATLAAVALIFTMTTSFASVKTPVKETSAKRTPPTVGSFVTLLSYETNACFEWAPYGSAPLNTLYWAGKRVKVLFVGTDCEGHTGGQMMVQMATVGEPTTYTISWPSNNYY